MVNKNSKIKKKLTKKSIKRAVKKVVTKVQKMAGARLMKPKKNK